MTTIPGDFKDKAKLVKGSLPAILETIQSKGFHNLYIDGGKTIQSFLREDLIDEMTITIIPILLGGGIPLFGDLPDMLHFECKQTRLFNGGAVQHTFTRKK
jgi:dihydrofolate reductase